MTYIQKHFFNFMRCGKPSRQLILYPQLLDVILRKFTQKLYEISGFGAFQLIRKMLTSFTNSPVK